MKERWRDGGKKENGMFMKARCEVEEEGRDENEMEE